MIEQGNTLVVLSPGFPKDDADSTCVPAQQLFVKNLKLNFPNLNIIVLAFQYPFLSAQYQWNDVTVIAFGGQNKGRFFRLLNWRRVSKTLRRLNKQHQLVGLLSFWMGDCAYVANLFAKRHHIKHFCWILGQDAKPGNKYFKWIKPQGEKLIALSDFIARETSKNYSVTPVHVIPVGIDPSIFGVVPIKRDIDILGAGSLFHLKQFPILINMVSALRNSFPSINAVICGDGPDREILAAMIKNLFMEKHIELAGELPHRAVLELMQRTKVFVHPSAYEGFGIVCLEALHAGAQVISFVNPIDKEIKNWHFADSQEEMLILTKHLLRKPLPDGRPVTPYLISDTCIAIMKMFDYSDSATA